MTTLLLIVAGGAGAVARHMTTRRLQQPGGFPVGTAFVNLVGGFAIGWVAARHDAASVAFASQVGFLGGFTTFSTWMVESLAMLPHRPVATAFNVVGMALAGIALAALGAWLGG